MKKMLLRCFLLTVCIFMGEVAARQAKPVDWVDPLIDTHQSRWFYFSSACRPFGMVNLSPDTNTKGSWKSGYLYNSPTIRCFSHIHAWQMSGIPIMPTSGSFKGHLGMDAYQSAFSHNTEIAVPGYHKVFLKDYDITAELTSTTRVGFHRYTFSQSNSSYILFDTGAYLGHSKTVESYVHKVSNREIEGWALMGKTIRRPKDTYVYFVAKLDKPFEEFGTWKDHEIIKESDEVKGKDAGAFVRYKTKKDEVIRMKVAIAYTSIVQARKNLKAELSHWDFDRIRKESAADWNQWLSRIQVEGGTGKQKTKLYTDLWHALQGRRIVSDVDGRYCDMTGPEPVIREVRLDDNGKPLFHHHAFDALWGSHWSLNILWSMAYPEIMEAFCNTMVDMYTHGGFIPRGPSGGNYTYVMIGDPAASFFACAYNKGIRNYDIQKAYEGLRKNAFAGGIRDRAGYEHGPNAKGGGMAFYEKLGYVPEDMGGEGMHRDGASMTLEYAYQDWCLAQLAKAIGKNDDYDLFMKRSQSYRHLWDDEVKLIHPRFQDGSWLEEFTAVGTGFNTRGFCESNAAIYTHFVPHDMPGLIELYGDEQAYTEALNRSFEKAKDNHFVAEHGKHAISYVDYENQPSTQLAHLFNYSGAPWLTQKWVRQVKEQAFGDITPYGGYNGDEDQGQMGALGVLMAIGLFEVRGGAALEPVYEITSPVFDKVTIDLNKGYYKGEKFTIVTKDNSKENMYIQSAKLNGKPFNRYWFTHADFAKGGTLELELGPEPNKKWGVGKIVPSEK